MGADGGSIAKRSELVRTAEKAENEDKNINSLWTQCSLSHQKLEDPVVSDYNGSLYNKTAVLELLLGTYNGPPPVTKRASQIRDVVELQRDIEKGRWIDPVSRKDLETEGFTERFAYLAECGHIGPKSVLLKASNCPICETHYRDMVIINPRTADSRQRNQTRIDRLLAEGKSNSLRAIKRPATRKRVSDEGLERNVGKSRKVL